MTNVYIKLLEGTESWVPVPAIRRGDNIFEILENRYLDLNGDISSIWEFFPGDTVRCARQGNDLMALELINSIFPKRKMHQLVFWIVRSLGEITLSEMRGFEYELNHLCSDTAIVQKRHPIVMNWLNKNCSNNGQAC